LAVNAAIEKYREHLTEKELKPVSVDTTEYRLRWFFTDAEFELVDLTPKQCSRLYEQLGARKVRGDRPISVHGLRGTHASLTATVGVTGHMVAQALGHTTYSTTARHYAKQEAIEAGRQREALRVLRGGRA
jgi:integrase